MEYKAHFGSLPHVFGVALVTQNRLTGISAAAQPHHLLLAGQSRPPR